MSGNPKGRPKKGDSFSEFVRKHYPPEKRRQAVERMVALACDPHDNHKARILAFAALHKAGWPNEQRPDVAVHVPLVPMFQLPAGCTVSVSGEERG